MNYISTIFLILSFNALSFVSMAQRDFVYFETTNNTNVVCQDKTFGVIATLLIDTQENHTFHFQWESDTASIRKVKDEIVVVNTSSPGEKRLKFVLNINENQKLDTTFIVNVLPKPVVGISFTSGELSFKVEGNVDVSSFKWIYNGKMDSSFDNEIIKNPLIGSYRVLVFDSNGCSATSREVVIN